MEQERCKSVEEVEKVRRRKKVSEIDKDLIRAYYGDSKYWRKRLLKNKNPRGTGHSTYKELKKKGEQDADIQTE
tara:strand:- start:1411 stop:1632 length:222 start_codon:yes stop_codon:yes gene_type:complete